MAYIGLHPPASGTVSRRTHATGPTGKRIPGASTAVGSLEGFFEDLDEETTARLVSGKAARLNGRWYADRSADLPVLRGDVIEFTDPATSESRSLEVINRRGPFDATDTEDHFELDLASEQPAGA